MSSCYRNAYIAYLFDNLRRPRKTVVNFLIREIKNNDYISILDFGCGTGNYLFEIDNKIQDLSLIGVDPSKSMLEIATKKNIKAKIINGDHEIIPLSDNSTDMIFMVNVVHHVTDIEKMFFELKRVLKKNGGLYIITESHDQIKEKAWLEYFDGAKETSLKIFHPISDIIAVSEKIGFSCYDKIIIDNTPDKAKLKNFFIYIEYKAFSILSLISKKSYVKGKAKMRNDLLQRKYITRHIAKTILCFKKKN